METFCEKIHGVKSVRCISPYVSRGERGFLAPCASLICSKPFGRLFQKFCLYATRPARAKPRDLRGVGDRFVISYKDVSNEDVSNRVCTYDTRIRLRETNILHKSFLTQQRTQINLLDNSNPESRNDFPHFKRSSDLFFQDWILPPFYVFRERVHIPFFGIIYISHYFKTHLPLKEGVIDQLGSCLGAIYQFDEGEKRSGHKCRLTSMGSSLNRWAVHLCSEVRSFSLTPEIRDSKIGHGLHIVRGTLIGELQNRLRCVRYDPFLPDHGVSENPDRNLLGRALSLAGFQ